MRKRVYAVLMATVVIFCGIGVRLFTLSDSSLRLASGQQSSRTQTIAVSRGTIYDRYLHPLVNTENTIIASVAPYEGCIAALRKGLPPAEAEQIVSLFDEIQRPVVSLSRWLPPTVGIVQVEMPERYAQQSLAPHVIGYTDGENCGVIGIEKGYDEVLMSYEGAASVSYAVDALGYPVEAVDDTVTNTLDQSVGGVALTLDAQIQSIIQQEAQELLERGAVLVTDAQGAQVLASSSFPLYDQNDVAAVLEDEASPLLDRTRINYNCGSVFKIITAAAALESGFPVETAYTCTGSYTVDGIVFGCHNTQGDGTLTMTEAMAVSCNAYFIQLALEVGKAAIWDMSQRAGLSLALSVATAYQTAAGVLPPEEDLSASAALANLAIGQGDLLVTPYHVHLLMQAVVNDGVWKTPTLFYGNVDESGRITPSAHQPERINLFSPSTAAALQTMLKDVVQKGTGMAAAPKSMTAAGKTGTAETGWIQNGKEVVQSWFTGYFPADNPAYVITVLSENGGANKKSAAPVFAAVCDALSMAGLVENP